MVEFSLPEKKLSPPSLLIGEGRAEADLFLSLEIDGSFYFHWLPPPNSRKILREGRSRKNAKTLEMSGGGLIGWKVVE